MPANIRRFVSGVQNGNVGLNLELDDGRASPALFRSSRIELFHVWMRSQHLMQRLLQNAFAVPVDNPQPQPAGEVSLVKELVHTLPGFFGAIADDVDFLCNPDRRSRGRAQDCLRARRGGASAGNDPDLALAHAHSQAANFDFDLVIANERGNRAWSRNAGQAHPVVHRGFLTLLEIFSFWCDAEGLTDF